VDAMSTFNAPKVTETVTSANADNTDNDSERRHDPLGCTLAYQKGLRDAVEAVKGGLHVEWYGSPAFINWQRQIVSTGVAAIEALKGDVHE